MIPLRDQDLIRQKFAQELSGPVKVDFFTERELALAVPGRKPCAYCKPTREMLQELAGLSDLISLRVHILDDNDGERRKFGIERIPATVLRGHGAAFFKFYGLPGGTEFPAFVECIVDVSRNETLLSENSVKELRKLKDDVTVRVFVTPACPYCPQMARAAYQLALTNPHVKAEVIEINEFPELADRHGVRAVPLTVINDRVAIPGAVPESVLVEQVLKAAESAVTEPTQPSGPTTAATREPQQPVQRGQQRDSGLFIP